MENRERCRCMCDRERYGLIEAPQTHGAAVLLCCVRHEAASGTAGLAAFDMKYQKCWLTFVKCEKWGGGEEKNLWSINHLPMFLQSSLRS